MIQKNVRPGAMRVFHKKYLPFIVAVFIKVAPVSYATEEELKSIWRTQTPYDKRVADHMEMQSKVFLTLAFERNDPRRFDIELLDDLTDMMARYLAPYFCQATTPPTPKSVIRERLKHTLFTENESVIRNKQRNEEREQKRAAKLVEQAAEEEKAAQPKQKRVRIIKTANNQSVHAVRIDIPNLTQKIR